MIEVYSWYNDNYSFIRAANYQASDDIVTQVRNQDSFSIAQTYNGIKISKQHDYCVLFEHEFMFKHPVER